MGAAPGERWVAACTSLEGPGGLRFQSWPRQPLGSRDLRLRIEAIGVNFPDLLMTRGRYQLRLAPPFVPGMEACGVVLECGEAVRGFAAGQRVVAHARHGLFTSEAVVPAAAASPAPPGFSAEECASYRVAALTAWHALADRASVKRDETVLILGAGGGVGLAAVEIATLLGAHVIAAASSLEKRMAACSRGAAHAVDYRSPTFVEKVREICPHGVDVVFDPVGGAAFEQALGLPAWNGRVLVVGFASGQIGVVPANLPLLKGYAVLGVRAGEATRRDPELLERAVKRIGIWTQEGRLKPLVSRRYALADAALALRDLEASAVTGRAVLLPPPVATSGGTP